MLTFVIFWSAVRCVCVSVCAETANVETAVRQNIGTWEVVFNFLPVKGIS